MKTNNKDKVTTSNATTKVSNAKATTKASKARLTVYIPTIYRASSPLLLKKCLRSMYKMKKYMNDLLTIEIYIMIMRDEISEYKTKINQLIKEYNDFHFISIYKEMDQFNVLQILNEMTDLNTNKPHPFSTSFQSFDIINLGYFFK